MSVAKINFDGVNPERFRLRTVINLVNTYLDGPV